MANNVTGLIVDMFDILQDTNLNKESVKQVLFDFFVSLEDNMFIDGAPYEFEECLGNHKILDDAINSYLDSIENPEEYEDDYEE